MSDYPSGLYDECSARAASLVSRQERDWSEAKSQTKIKNFLDGMPLSLMHPLDWWHIKNEGKRSGRQAGQLRNSGLTRGVVDLCVGRPGAVDGYSFHQVWIELKRVDRTNHATREQLQFIARRRLWGDIAEVCYGHHEAIELLMKCYGW